MRVASVVGARPQFIKAAVVSRVMREFNASGSESIEELIIHTGQHYDENMSKVFFRELDIPIPSWNLGIGNCSHGAMTGRMLEKIEDVLCRIQPDWVLVYGDTNSTLAGALAAKKMNLKLAHVESGLRSFNIRMPEEQNRIVSDRLSDLLFCPTETAVENLRVEGIPSLPYGQKVMNVGDVMYDATLYYLSLAETRSDVKRRLDITQGEYILCTIHRAENTNEASRLLHIVSALKEIAHETKVIFPLHPRTRRILMEARVNTGDIKVVDPVSYFDMLILEKGCKCIITDSGGVQKEAYFLQKPCITIRDETEWIELVRAGVNFLVCAERKKIIDAVKEWPSRGLDFSQKFYGSGDAGKKIVESLLCV